MTLTTRHWDRLGNGGLSFTELGFGAAPMANLYRPVTEADVEASLKLPDRIRAKLVGGYDVDRCRKTGKYIAATADRARRRVAATT